MKKLLLATLVLLSLSGIPASAQTLVQPRNGGTGVANNQSATFTRSGNHALTITTTGATNVTLPTAGTVCASGNACSVSSVNFGGSTLSTYATGTWTPAVGGSATYTLQSGSYTRIGNIVHAELSLTINVLGTGSAINISGLPYAAVGAASKACLVSYFSGIAGGNVVMLSAYIPGAVSIINFASLAAAGTGMTAAATVIGDGASFVVTCDYTTT